MQQSSGGQKSSSSVTESQGSASPENGPISNSGIVSLLTGNITMDTQEKISIDFQITMCVRQRDVRVGINLSLRQDTLQALTCLRSQRIALRLDVFKAKTQGQMSTSASVQPCLPASNDSKTPRAIDVVNDKSEVLVHISSQQHWSWRAKHSECKRSIFRASREPGKTLVDTSS